jgi:hypothetical protein|nr:MAG TPA: hypothetical protein [Caudoviricetes sp.]
MITKKFGLCTFSQAADDIFIVADNGGDIRYCGDNPIAAMVTVMGEYETAVRNALLPNILKEGYDRAGRKIKGPAE